MKPSRLRGLTSIHTARLQQWLTERLGAADWFGGEDFDWADAAAAPMVNRSVHYGLGPDPVHGSPAGIAGCVSARQLPRPLPNSMRRRAGWRKPRTTTARVVAGANTATIVSNG